MAQKITVAELLVDLGIGKNDAAKAAEKLDTRLGKAKKSAKALGSGLTKLAKGFAVFAAAATGAALGVFKFVDSVTATVDEAGKAAEQFGTTVEGFQRMSFAAKQSGSDVGALSMALKNQSRFIRDAQLTGVTPFTQALEEVGLTLQDLAELDTPEKRFGLIGDALRDVEDKAQRVALAQKLVGEESGPRLLPFLLGGTKGLKAYGDEAERVGAIIDEKGVAASERFQGALGVLKGALDGLKNTIGISLIPVMQDLVERFTSWVVENRKILSQRVPEFFERIVSVAKRLLPVFEALGKAFVFVVENLDLLIGLLAGVKLASAFAAAATGFTAMGFAASAALGPIGLIIGALTALIPLALRAGNALGDFLARDESILRATKRRKAPQVSGVASELGSAIAKESDVIRREDAKIIALQQRGEGGSFAEKEAIRRRNAAAKRKAGLERRQAGEFRKAEGEARAEAAEAALPTPALGPELPPGFVEPGTEAARKRGGARRAEKEKKRPLSITSVSDLLTAAAGGDIEGLAERTPSVEGVEPTVAISITNNNLNFENKQTISGVMDPVRAGREAAQAAQRVFRERLSEAGQQLAGNKVV